MTPLFSDLLYSKKSLDEVSKAGTDTAALVKDALRFIEMATSDPLPYRKGSNAEKTYREWINRAQEIVSKFATGDVGRDALHAAYKSVPGMRPHVMRSPEIQLDTEALGFKVTKKRIDS